MTKLTIWGRPAVLSLYKLVTNLIFILFSVVLIVAGLCHALESFKVMSEEQPQT